MINPNIAFLMKYPYPSLQIIAQVNVFEKCMYTWHLLKKHFFLLRDNSSW